MAPARGESTPSDFKLMHYLLTSDTDSHEWRLAGRLRLKGAGPATPALSAAGRVTYGGAEHTNQGKTRCHPPERNNGKTVTCVGVDQNALQRG